VLRRRRREPLAVRRERSGRKPRSSSEKPRAAYEDFRTAVRTPRFSRKRRQRVHGARLPDPGRGTKELIVSFSEGPLGEPVRPFAAPACRGGRADLSLSSEGKTNESFSDELRFPATTHAALPAGDRGLPERRRPGRGRLRPSSVPADEIDSLAHPRRLQRLASPRFEAQRGFWAKLMEASPRRRPTCPSPSPPFDQTSRFSRGQGRDFGPDQLRPSSGRGAGGFAI